MSEDNLFQTVLTIGPSYDPPKGGIAFVIHNYKRYVFRDDFLFVANSCDGTRIKKILFLIKAICKLLFVLITNKKVQIVHIHTASNFSFRRSAWFAACSKVFHRKVIMHIHGGYFKEYYRTNTRFVSNQLGRSDAVVALSDEWKCFFQNEVGLNNVYVINNLIAPPQVKEFQVKDSKLHALFIGLITPKKGIYDLLKSISMNKMELKDRFLLHVGGDGDVDKLKKIINENNLQDLVVYEGWISGAAKSKLMNQCRLLVLPSYIEGLPLTVLEGMSYGMAILASDVGAIPSVVKNNSNGLLVNPGDVIQLGNQLVYLTNNQSTVLDMGKKSLDNVDMYLPESVKSQLQHLYKSV